MRTRSVTFAIGVLFTTLGSAQQPPSASIAVTRVNVIDATGAPIKRDMTVVINDGKISAVVPAATARVPANAQVVDRDGAPIAGLYAVGNDAASVFEGTYPAAGATLGPAMTFGYVAGRHLAGAGG